MSASPNKLDREWSDIWFCAPIIFHMSSILPGTQGTNLFERINGVYRYWLLKSSLLYVYITQRQRSKQMNFPGCLELELRGRKKKPRSCLKLNKNKEEKTWQDEIIQTPTLPFIFL